MARTTAFQRSVCAIRTGTPAAPSTRTISRAAAAVGASGFSMRSGLRAAATAAASAGCSVGGTAAPGILLERAGEPAPYEGGAAGERAGLARAGGEEHERLQELGAPGDAEHGVLAPVEVVGERDGLPGLVAEVIAHVRHAVGDRAGHVLQREGAEEAIGARPGDGRERAVHGEDEAAEEQVRRQRGLRVGLGGEQLLERLLRRHAGAPEPLAARQRPLAAGLHVARLVDHLRAEEAL